MSDKVIDIVILYASSGVGTSPSTLAIQENLLVLGAHCWLTKLKHIAKHVGCYCII